MEEEFHSNRRLPPYISVEVEIDPESEIIVALGSKERLANIDFYAHMVDFTASTAFGSS